MLGGCGDLMVRPLGYALVVGGCVAAFFSMAGPCASGLVGLLERPLGITLIAAGGILLFLARDSEAEVATLRYLDLLRDPDFETRLYAVRMLGSLGTDAVDAVPELRTACKDVDPRVRAAAREALESIQEGGARSRHHD